MGWFEDRFTYSPAKTEVICTVCSAVFWMPPSKAGLYRRCTPECVALHADAIKKSKTRNCLHCQKEFVARTLREGKGRYCSIKCSTTARDDRNSPEAISKRKETYARSLSEGRITVRSGEDHPQWTGGREASMQRRRDSGMDTIRSAAYRKRNPERAREWMKKRSRGYVERLPRGTVKRIGEAQRWKCAICRVSVRGKYHVDHVLSLIHI